MSARGAGGSRDVRRHCAVRPEEARSSASVPPISRRHALHDHLGDLDLLAIEGAIVSIDAMGCQKEIAKKIVGNL